jgi:hypothetical protein
MYKSHISLVLAVLVATFLTGIQTRAQISPFKMDVNPDGFSGEYSSQDLQLFVEFRSSSADSSVSRIKNSDGKVIAESLLVNKIVTIKIEDVVLTFNLNRGEPDPSRVSSLSDSDTKKLEAFLGSERSAPIRILLAELFKQKDRLAPRALQGFLAIAMVLGDGP